ncbi:sensor histidine kinase [Sediminibacterium roseum]|uniref:histidine kinase n=1 Tax=Sediminibacterium roseum TaxID=1978412 RepID=A0ABW9ZT37_9BACT|nr:sensor histidine kinase [Sediminibacterium roseum]NCI50281.1 sensor histidine kinase [Sediminibacterium roseum]
MRIHPQYRIVIVLAVLAGSVFPACKNEPRNRIDHTDVLDSFFYSLKLTGDGDFLGKIDSISRSIKNPGIKDQWNVLSYKYAYYYYRAHAFKTAIVYADSMLQLLDRKPDFLPLYAKTLFLKGDAFLSQRRYSESFTWYYKGRLAILEKRDSCALSEYSARLATVCYVQKKYVEAAGYYKQSIKETERCPEGTFDEFAQRQGNYDNIGICYVRANMKDSAGVYFDKALAYIDANEHRFPEKAEFIQVARAVIYGNKANVAIDDKRYTEAEQLLGQSIAINEHPLHAPEDAVYSRIKLAKLYQLQKRFDEAEKIVQQIDSTRRPYKNPDLSEGYFLLRSRQSENTGDHKAAYAYLSEYNRIRDSVANVSGPVTSVDIQQELDDVARQFQLTVLKKENKVKTEYLILMVVIAVLAVLVVILVLLNYRRSRRNVMELTQLHDEVTHKNAALQQTLTALEQSHQNNNRFMRIVAHDLRGPVGAINSLAEILQQGGLPDDKKDEMLRAIHTSGTKSMNLINDLLNDMQAFSKLKNIEIINIADILRYCVALYEHQVQEKNQVVILDTVPAYVSGDQEKLWRVFSNLVSNAIKFSRQNGEIRITTELNNGQVIIAIHDQGIGIPDNFKHRIFESTGAGSPGTSGEASFGLGLSISKQIISLHKGKIWFESEKGQGASFFVSLPLAEQPVSQ